MKAIFVLGSVASVPLLAVGFFGLVFVAGAMAAIYGHGEKP